MDINGISQLISSLGFPIVCVLCLGWFIHKVWSDNRTDVQQQIKTMEENYKAREDKLYHQIEKFSESLDNFNVTLTRIDTRLDYLEKLRVEKNQS